MKKAYFLSTLFLLAVSCLAQPYKFYYSNRVKFLKTPTDTLLNPFTGGLNSPQFSNIDLNNDGIKDLFIFDRESSKHLTFLMLNNKWIYAPQYESAFPYMNDWAILKDYNYDGKPDILTEISQDPLLDTTGFLSSSGLRVIKNSSTTSKLKFDVVYNKTIDTGGWWVDFGVPRLPEQVSIARTDIPGIEDMDGDGDLDIVSNDGQALSLRYYENWNKNYLNKPYHPDTVKYVLRDKCWGYIFYDINANQNKWMLNMSKSQIANCDYQSYPKKKRHSGSTSLLLDVNNDGNKDLIFGDVLYNTLTVLYNKKNLNSNTYKRDTFVSQDTLFPSNTQRANFINFPAAYYVDIDNDNTNELLVTTNNANTKGIKNLNNVWVYENTGTNNAPVFSYAGNNFDIYNQTIDLGKKAIPTAIDVDNDGDKDIILTTNGNSEISNDAKDRMVLYENVSPSATQPLYRLKDTDFLQICKDTSIFDMHPSFGDLNGDGKPDMIIGDINGFLAYYANQSSGASMTSMALQSRRYANINVGANAAPQIVDLNKDGKLDLVIGRKNGTLAYYQNNGTTTSPSFNNIPTIDSLGKVLMAEYYFFNGQRYYYNFGYAAPHIVDLDMDGKYEMLVGSYSGQISLFTNVTATPNAGFTRYDNIFSFDTSSTNSQSLKLGLRSSVFVTDFDGDSKPDVLAGNIRGGISLMGSIKNGSIGIRPFETATPTQIILYPNPAQDYVSLSLENIYEDITYHIYDEVGKLITTDKVNKYHSVHSQDISGLKAGIYFITYKGDNGYTQTGKFIVYR